MFGLDFTRWGALLGIALGGTSVLSGNCVFAQMTSDDTLPNNSRVIQQDNIFNITGGTQAGANLFYSFQEFSVPTGSIAAFNNAVDIQNIISRVTGQSVSNMDGLIRANGTANVFLINPNGIVFGENARLDIGGSFVASTASSVKFADGLEFSATNLQSTSLLSINVPMGLQYGANPGAIQVLGDGQGLRSTKTELIDTQNALRVLSNQTLALVGGDISLEGATLKTAGGRIELGSVVGEGLVSLTPTEKGFSLGYGNVQNFGNIQLSQQASVDVSGEGGGDVQLTGRHITLAHGSQIEASTLGAKPGGNLTVTADSVQLIGTSADGWFPSGLFAQVLNLQTRGDAGELTINTRHLLIRDGAQVSTSTFGQGKAGNLFVTADSMQLIGRTANGEFPTALGSSAQQGSTGDGGNLRINTRELLIQDGAQIGAGTFGGGKGGNLTVIADIVQLIGGGPALYTQADQNSTGNAGDLTINTRELLVRDGAEVNTSTFGTGNGGNLIVTADSIQLSETSTNPQFITGLFAASNGTADAGKAGNINITAKGNYTANNAFVSAGAQQGGGGNINITAKDIRLRNNSDIRTDLSTGQASGGNITLNANTIIALEDSDILAFAPEGKGGNITFNTRALFTSPVHRPTQTATDANSLQSLKNNNRVDINATGAVAGNIIGVLDNTFVQNSLTDLQNNLIDTNTLIANSCIARSPKQKGTFLITGYGALPTRPGDALASTYPTGDVQNVTNDSATRGWKKGDRIVEPEGVYRLANGQLVMSRECR